MPNFSLTGKLAIVTGARRGIGKAIALTFAGAGADVVVCDVETEDGELKNVADQIKSMGRQSLSVRADVSIKRDVENLVTKVLENFQAIDILVNNAGILVRSPLLDLLEEDWDKIINVDLKGCFLCSQAVGKRMAARNEGNIINIATQWAFKTTPGMGVYSIAKAGVVMLTRALARELSVNNIRVNAIAPGMVKTKFSMPDGDNSEVLERISQSVPLGRAGEVNDITGTALFLASEASSYISGHTIIVDGGGLS